MFLIYYAKDSNFTIKDQNPTSEKKKRTRNKNGRFSLLGTDKTES